MDGSFVPALSHARLWGNPQQLGHGRVQYSALMWFDSSLKAGMGRYRSWNPLVEMRFLLSTLRVLYMPGNGRVSLRPLSIIQI